MFYLIRLQHSSGGQANKDNTNDPYSRYKGPGTGDPNIIWNNLHGKNAELIKANLMRELNINQQKLDFLYFYQI